MVSLGRPGDRYCIDLVCIAGGGNDAAYRHVSIQTGSSINENDDFCVKDDLFSLNMTSFAGKPAAELLPEPEL